MPGQRQGDFLPVEQVLAYASMFVADPSAQGGSNWTRYHWVFQAIGQALKRSPGSISNKGLNLMGRRAHGQAHEADLFAALGSGELPFAQLYEVTLHGARAAGVGEGVLPDVLELLDADEPELALFVGDQEVTRDELEHAASEIAAEHGNDEPSSTTMRMAFSAVRIGQSRFARTVLKRFDGRCGFCGLDGKPLAGHRMTVASHIKPWRHSTPRERLDARNGVAACPSHDAAFDTGLITVTDDLGVRVAGKLAVAAEVDASIRLNLAVQEHLLVPEASPRPATKYLRWHRENIWVNGLYP